MTQPPTPLADPAQVAALLAQPLRLGPVVLRNPIVFGAAVTNYGRGNVFTPRHLAFYRARAAGGAGLIVTEALTVHPLDHPYEHVPCGHSDGIVPSLRALAAEVREAGAEAGLGPGPAVLAQLNHTGGQCDGRWLRQSPWAPSAAPDVASRRVPRAMEAEHIAQVVAGFAAAAGRVVAAGLDGVELNAAQHALLRQFLSPLTNHRDDAYGGSPENRYRLLAEVVRAVRATLGPGAVLGVKLCGDELAPWGGLTPEDGCRIAQWLVRDGGVDYLAVQIGGPFSEDVTDAGMPTPQGHAAYLAAGVRRAVGAALPVLAEGRIDAPAVAAGLLAAGQADGVVMTHALLTDPDLPRKVAGADPEPLRPHVGLRRHFAVRGPWNRPLGDLMNPRAGREAILPPPVRRSGAGSALVIGAGPAGLEAATTLARQGCRVRLVDRAAAPGGWAARLAAQVPARGELGRLPAYYAALLERLGVEFQGDTEVTGWSDDLAGWERIVLATGAAAPPPPAELAGGPPCLSPRVLLADGGPAPAAGRAVVVDSEGGFRMGAAVEWLLARGLAVDVLSEDFLVGRELAAAGELSWFGRVRRADARFHPRTRVGAVDGAAVEAVDRFSGAHTRLEGVTLLVAATPEVPADGLLDELRARHPRVLPVGDARAPRLMGEAIFHAHRSVLPPWEKAE